MPATDVAHLINQLPGLRDAGLKLARTVHRSIVEGGEQVRSVADFLHGTWLGHPLHPVLTDVTVGSWTLASFFDGVSRITDSEEADRQADTLAAIGLASALPTAITGLTDFSAIKKDAAGPGLLHALSNCAGVACYLWSLRERRRGHRGSGRLWSLIGLTAIAGGAWLGGHLVYRERVGVNHSSLPPLDAVWVTVMDADELPEGTPTCVDINGRAVLLVRNGRSIYALANTCSHAGGRLHEGTLNDGYFVQCPLHDSVFDVRTGQVTHGPATHPQPRVAARLHNGQVEVRRA